MPTVYKEKSPSSLWRRGAFFFVYGGGLKCGESFLDLLRLVQGPETPCANFYFYRLTVTNQRLLVDVRGEFGLGVPIGMANVITRHPIL